MQFLVVAFMLIYFLAIIQDFVFSKVKYTGFYLSESAAFNLFWLLFIPGVWMVIKFRPHLLLRLVFPFVHILIFVSAFILISIISYETPHRFSMIFKTVISGHFYLALLIYVLVPYLFKKQEAIESTTVIDEVLVKKGRVLLKVPISSIVYLQTDKPYIKIVTEDVVHLHNETLKSMKSKLNAQQFVQVNRSAVINRNFVSHLVTRGNGDYDLLVRNGTVIRCSRHYREEWGSLLEH
jgi:two-component system LytT family response regulator